MKCVLSLILFFFCAFLYAQEKIVTPTPFQNEKGDTLLSSSVDQNKLAVDTLTVSDSTKAKKKYDVDAVVFASSSDSLIFDVQKKKMYLYNNGELKYKDTDLKSGQIFVDYETNQLEAFGITDTADTAKVKLKQTPKLVEGKDNYEGSHIKYNFKNQSGFISLAKNKEKTQRYEGEKVKKVDKTTYFIKNGLFTTCEKDTPDTYFSASQMKVIQKDEIVARWIFMHVGGVPFPIPLPFAVFPNETGRRSGIIIPTYGKDLNRGQYFKNFGYFWAVSDYFDETLTADYYLKGGYGLHNRIRYAKRYDFSGALTAAYSNLNYGQPGDPAYSKSEDYNISWYHNQQIDPTSRLDVNLQFMSSNYYSTNSISYNDLLSQNIISNATFSKSWTESGSSLNINYSRTQNLSTGNIYETLPNVSFSKSMTYPFKNDDSETSANQKWYELIGYSYTGQFLNNRNKTNGQLDIHGGFKHDISVSASPKIGYFSVSPNVNYTEKWYNKRIKYEKVSYQTIDSKTGNTITADSIRKSTINDLNFVRTFSLGVSASTRMYGIYNPNMLGVESFRHTLTPTISYSYQPNFGNDGWGYFDSYTDINGKVQRYDKFDGQVFGGVNSFETQQISFGLGNVFEIKMAKSANDTTKEQKKIQLLNFNASMGYNFAADSIKLSDLNLSYRTQVGDLLNFSGSSSYTFYDYDSEGKKKLNQFLASKGKGLFRLTNFNFSVSTSLTGDKIKSDESKKDESEEEENTEKDEGFNAFQKKDYIALYDDSQSPDLSIPWNLNLSYNYNFSKTGPSVSTSYSNMSMDLGFSLTKNWKFSVRGSYDFQDKKISAPQVTIYRDLHCWEMNFTWNPLGTYSGFHFEIRMKAPEFKDVKVTKSGGLYSGKR